MALPHNYWWCEFLLIKLNNLLFLFHSTFSPTLGNIFTGSDETGRGLGQSRCWCCQSERSNTWKERSEDTKCLRWTDRRLQGNNSQHDQQFRHSKMHFETVLKKFDWIKRLNCEESEDTVCSIEPSAFFLYGFRKASSIFHDSPLKNHFIWISSAYWDIRVTDDEILCRVKSVVSLN